MTRESACILSHAFLRNWQLRVIWAVFMDMGAITPPAGYDGARYVEETAEAVEAKESQIMPRLFGTDGVRGLANRDLTARLALDLGDAAVRVLGNSAVREGLPEGRRRALIGRDTRVSGDFSGVRAVRRHVCWRLRRDRRGHHPHAGRRVPDLRAQRRDGRGDLPSHNPMPDNGIKFFARGGFKLPDSKEDDIEAVLGQDWDRPTGAGVGRVSHETVTATNLYIDHLVSTIAPLNPDKTQPKPLRGLKIVADCANGATSVVAPEALRRAGAEGAGHQRLPGRIQHQQERRFHAPRAAAGHGQGHRRGDGRRVRRRRRPMPRRG